MRIVYLVLCCLIALGTYAQADSSFYAAIGTIADDEGLEIYPDSDSTYIIIGNTGKNEAQTQSDFYILKIDTNAAIIWSLVVGTEQNDQAQSAAIRDNGNIVITGYSNYTINGDYNLVVAEVSPTGNLLKFDTYGGSDWDLGRKIEPTDDGGFIVVGESFSFANGRSSGYVIKLDANADLEWQLPIGRDTESALRAVTYSDSGYYLCAGYRETTLGDKNFWLTAVSTTGDSLWSKDYGSAGNEEVFDMLQISNGSIGLCGFTDKEGKGEDFYFIRLDSTYQNAYEFLGSYDGQDRLVSLVTNPNEDFIMAGFTNSVDLASAGYNGAVFIVSNDDLYLFGSTYGYAEADRFFGMTQSTSLGLMLIGTTNSFGNGLNDILVTKTYGTALTNVNNTIVQTDTQSAVLTSIPVSNVIDQTAIRVYPNPITDHVVIDAEASYDLRIYNLNGQVFYARKGLNNQTEVSFEGFEKGHYIISLTFEGNQVVNRIIQHI